MKKNKLPKAVTLAILTLITVFFWIFFSVFRLLATKPNTKVPEPVLLPFSSDLNKEIVKEMGTRIFFEKGQNQP